MKYLLYHSLQIFFFYFFFFKPPWMSLKPTADANAAQHGELPCRTSPHPCCSRLQHQPCREAAIWSKGSCDENSTRIRSLLVWQGFGACGLGVKSSVKYFQIRDHSELFPRAEICSSVLPVVRQSLCLQRTSGLFWYPLCLQHQLL